MTLDAVAKQAGVSKGGLLYHFPSKDALLTAMVERYVCHLSEAEQAAASESASPVHGFLKSRLAQELGEPQKARVTQGMIAAMLERPSLLDPLREHNRQLWQSIKSTGPNQESGVLAWLALDGLLFQEAFNTCPLSAQERARITEAILRLAQSAK